MRYPSLLPSLSPASISLSGAGPALTLVDCCPLPPCPATRFASLAPGGLTSVASLSVSNCDVRPNRTRASLGADELGGALLLEARELEPWEARASLNVTDVTFRGNRARRGGGVAVEGTEVEVFVEGCAFEGNVATEAGGGVYFETVKETALPSRIRGGLAVAGCRFENNSAAGEGGTGGGIAAYGGNDLKDRLGQTAGTEWLDRLLVSDSSFLNNSAFMGGALFATGEPAGAAPGATSPAITVADASEVRLVSDRVERCEFRGNAAAAQGGAAAAVHVYGGLTLEASRFEGNVARGVELCPQGDESCAGSGGAVQAVYAPLIIRGGVFDGNGAGTGTEFSPRGGAVFGFYDTHGTLDPAKDTIPK
ncbi:hypothetical protein TeGR_g14038, partial [Tetraparma gracilis]